MGAVTKLIEDVADLKTLFQVFSQQTNDNFEHMRERIEGMETKQQHFNVILTGNGTPERGLAARLMLLERIMVVTSVIMTPLTISFIAAEVGFLWSLITHSQSIVPGP